MFLQSKFWMLVSAIGQGVLFSMALSALVRICCWYFGTNLSPEVANGIFLLSSMLTGAVTVLIYARKLKQIDQDASGPISANPRS